MGFDIGSFHEKCAKSFQDAADKCSKLAKCYQRLANKSTSDDDHREIAKHFEDLADHCADLADHHTQAAKAPGGIDTHDDSSGIHDLAGAAGAGLGKFGMLKAMEDDDVRSRVIPAQKSDTPYLASVPPEFEDIFKS